MIHKKFDVGGIHIPYNWVYADAAARAAAGGFEIADIGKMARQLDDNSFWILTAITPTWAQIGSGGGGGGGGGGETLGPELIVNGGFDADTDWNKNGAWVISGGVASLSASMAPLVANVPPLKYGAKYRVTYTVTITAGDIAFWVGFNTPGITRTTSGTYTEDVIADGPEFEMDPRTQAFTGTVDNISVKEIIPETVSGGRAFLEELDLSGLYYVDFTWLPTVFKKLTIEGVLRWSGTSSGNTGGGLKVDLNGDYTDAHYYSFFVQQWHGGDLVQVYNDRRLGQFEIPNANSPANMFARVQIEILQYANPNVSKIVHCTMASQWKSVSSQMIASRADVSWNSASAVNRIRLVRAFDVNDGTFVSGSVLRSYGEY